MQTLYDLMAIYFRKVADATLEAMSKCPLTHGRREGPPYSILWTTKKYASSMPKLGKPLALQP